MGDAGTVDLAERVSVESAMTLAVPRFLIRFAFVIARPVALAAQTAAP